MNKNKKIKMGLFLSFVFTGVLSFSLSHPSNIVHAQENLYGCNPDATRISEVDTDAEFKAYLQNAGIPYSKYISKAGKTLTVNKNYAVNRCLIVYGTPNDVVTEGRKQQQLGDNGEYLFLGYNENGIQYNNPEYPDLSTQIDYVQASKFVQNPWDKNSLQNNIAISPTKPYTVSPGTVNPDYYDPSIKRVRTVAEELDRAFDRFYISNCDTNCSLGRRGYFPKVNTVAGQTLVGSNLQNYASVQSYPDEYAAGVFNLYRITEDSDYRFATFYLPPYKLFLQEKRDLSIKINSVTPFSVNAGENYTVNYTVCNLGQLPVQNPVINFGSNSSQTGTKTINTTLREQDCYTSNISQTAADVSETTNKTYYMTVNKNDDNPKDEDDRTNNTSTKAFTIVKKVINGRVSIISHTPTYPHSNQSVSVTYKVCNNSTVAIDNAAVAYGFTSQTSGSTYIGHMNAGECKTLTSNHTTPVVKDYTGPVTYKVSLSGGFKDDVDTSDNSDTSTITVRNPDMATKVIVDNDSSDNTIGDVKVKVSNKMFSTTTENCEVYASGCYNPTSSTPDYFRVYIYDTKFTVDTSDDTRIGTIYLPKYTLNHGENYYFNIDKSVFINYVNNKYPNSYQLVQFRVKSEIPHYTGEVDFYGNPSYENNIDESVVNYFPPRPNMAATECNTINHSFSNYFVTPDGYNPIKICAGHYPTYPSTTVESGMQAYHYVLYRFFPEPIPKYNVATPESDTTNPNHFSQIYTLPSTEETKQLGDFDSMFFPNKTSNGYYQERGRYMPTGGMFNFEVYKKESDGTKGKTVAIGTVSYNIPSTCYSNSALDINHQYGCDEILFFLPNSDVGSKKFEKPASYTSSTVTYPIKDTKIPYLNPGKYTFEFKANENFKYYYQQNQINTGYNWSSPKFK